MRTPTISLALAFSVLIGTAAAAQAQEIRPTPKMLAEAQRMQKGENPDDPAYPPTPYEYHFRNLGGHILWCAHASGGNGGFCKRLPPGYVAEVDRNAAEYCKTSDDPPAHATYGELWDLVH
jgi:hypothetical protein